MNITFTTHGVPEMLAHVRRLGDAFSQDVEAAALKKAAKPIAQDIANRVDADHHQTGLTGADIRAVASREAREEGAAAVLIGATGRRGAGRGRAFILSFLEFGTFRTPGFHIVATAFRQNSADLTKTVAKELAGAFKRSRAKFLRSAS